MSDLRFWNCKDRAEWLVERRKTIGASEIPALLGRCRWQSPFELYCDRMGLGIETRSEVEDDHLAMGNAWQEAVARRWAEINRRRLDHAGDFRIARNVRFPLIHATLDYGIFVDDPDATEIEAALECKNLGAYALPEWEYGVPIAVQIQLMAQTAVMDYRWGAVAAAVGGTNFRQGRIDRSDRFIAAMYRRVEEFARRLENGDPPPPTGSVRDKERIGRIWAVATEAEPVRLPPEAEDWDLQRRQAIEEEKRAKEKRQEAENLLKKAIGSHSRAVWDRTGRVAYEWSNKVKKYKARPASAAREQEYRDFKRIGDP